MNGVSFLLLHFQTTFRIARLYSVLFISTLQNADISNRHMFCSPYSAAFFSNQACLLPAKTTAGESFSVCQRKNTARQQCFKSATLPLKTTLLGNGLPSTVFAVVVTIFVHICTFIVIILKLFSTVEQCSKTIVLCKNLHTLPS